LRGLARGCDRVTQMPGPTSTVDEIERPLLAWFGLVDRTPASPVARLRVRNGLSQAELAAKARVSRQTIGSIERGNSVPSVRLALAIAVALETTVETLFGGRADP
jgi:putative transcriptional regulator